MLFTLLLDGFITSYWTSSLETAIGLFIPRTVLLVTIILTFYYPTNFMYLLVAVIGFIMDAYYLGFIGVYMVAFILTVAIVSNLKNVIRPNVLSYTLSAILVLTVCEMVVFVIMRTLGITSVDVQTLIVTRMSATLLYNGLIMLIFSFFIDRLVVITLDEGK